MKHGTLIDQKLKPVSKLENEKKMTSKNWSVIYITTVIFPIYGRFEAIWKPDYGCLTIILVFH